MRCVVEDIVVMCKFQGWAEEMILFLLLLFATSILSYIALRRLSRMVYAQSVFDQENERTVHKGAITQVRWCHILSYNNIGSIPFLSNK